MKEKEKPNKAELDKVKKPYDNKKTLNSFERKLSRLSDKDHINALKVDILQKISEPVDGAKDFKYVLGESRFQVIADYYNAATEVDLDKESLSAEEVGKSVVISEFAALSVEHQNAWLYWMSLGNVDFTKPDTLKTVEDIFGKGGQTISNITALAKRPATRFEVLFPGKTGYSVTAQDIEDAVR